MSRAKCAQCGLVNSIDDNTCRRCGVGLYDFTGRAKTEQVRREINLPLGKIAIAAAAAFGIYYWTSMPATPPPAPQAGPKPQPTLSAREEHESQKKQAYTTAIKNSGGLADHQKRTAETEKFMANTQK